MMTALLLLTLACDEEAPPEPEGALAVRASVEQVDIPSGEPVALTVEVYAPEGARIGIQPPAAEGLTVTPTAQEGPLPAGERLRQVFRYELAGDDGSYIIQPGGIAELDADEQPVGDPIVAPPIFVDLGVDGPSGGEMAGFAAAPEQAPPWGWIAVGAGLLGLVGLGAAAYLRRPTPEPVPEVPEVRARKRWKAARAAGMPDPALALTLSAVFRDYLEERHGFSATANTSREIIASLKARSLMGASERQKLASILEAEDRLKYGGEGGGATFFDALEAAFEDILRAGEAPDA